jgi:hypothetical protein
MILRRAAICISATTILVATSATHAEQWIGEFRVEAVVHVRGREAFTVAARGTGGRKVSLPLELPDPKLDDHLRNAIRLSETKQEESLGHEVQLVISRGADRALNCDIEWRFRAASRGPSGGPRVTTTGVREVFTSVEGKPQRLVLERDVDGDPRSWIDFIVKDAQIYIVTYNVADLLVPPDDDQQDVVPDFESIVKAIRTKVQPDAWKDGGECSVTPFPRNLSLVISASPGMHAEVQKLLEKLRQERALVDRQ